MTDLPPGFTEEMIQDVMKHTEKDRDTIISEMKNAKKNFDLSESALEKMSDPNEFLKMLPKLLKGLSGSLNPVKFKVTIENVDAQKLADVAALGKKWEDLEVD